MEFVLVNKFFRVGKTEVSIQCDKPFTFFTRELEGDRLGDTDETLIEAVKEILRTELDPTSAIVQAQAKLQETQTKLQENQAKLEQTEQKLAETEQKATQTEAKQNDLEALANRINKVVRVMAQDSIMGEKVSYGTTYKEMVELFPIAEVGKVYEPGAIFAVEDPNHAEVYGEGKRILVQLNKEFTYNGEPVSDFARNGRLELDGTGAAWKFEPKEQNAPTTVAPATTVSTTATVTPTVSEPSAATVAPN